MTGIKLEPMGEGQITTLMSWLSDRQQCLQWGGPNFRYPFDRASFLEDCYWRELQGYVISNPEGEMLAFGQYHERRGRCHLGRLIVAPEHRGAGLGKILVTLLAQTGSRALNAAECSLFVLRANLPARGLYEKLGFVETACREQSERPHLCDFMVAPVEAICNNEKLLTGQLNKLPG
ncbi:GNAT family N-acetyltransferase [Microbulbifer sp. TYP-18]|uniref:GNAT family N-acetyltransferase n=1 Tax=Microbulbifer sp. TYP-18 TaxID=3230024 RepID=UPI0034C5D14B